MEAKEAQRNKIVTPYMTMWMEDEILCSRYADDLHVSMEVAKACVESRLLYSRGKSYAVLVDMKGIKSTTREAREYLASVGATLIKAGALITGSAFNRMLGNVFLAIDKPPVPTRLFTDEEKAREWLRRYL